MPSLRPAAALLALLTALAPLPALAAQPARVVHDSLAVPVGMDAAEALASVEDLPAIFAHYEPVLPWVPGVKLDLDKELLSPMAPVVMALPVHGSVFGRPIEEQAQVTATTEPMLCTSGAPGVRVELSFHGSSHNVERRVDRIEISACPRTGDDGELLIDATGELFEGPLPRDPALNAFEESVGAKALQGAFLKQVPAVFDAVLRTWEDRQLQAS